MTLYPVQRRPVRGFTLIELAVVVVMIGVLAAFGVPKFLESVERSKASEAFAYLSAVRTAQERYMAREGSYADNVSKLDFAVPVPKYFTLPDGNAIATAGENDWMLTLTRKDYAAGSTKNYQVTFTQDGFDANSSIPAAIRPVSR